ncbi:hypothetical protein HN803_08580, partial [candidate division WWE3 bacterium]|nr:hypothetical protein [candidate division WWE3 bacterium]
ISKWIENRELVRTDDGETTDAKTLASQIGLIKAIKDYDLKRMISFHSRVKSAEWFAEDLHNAMDFVSDEHRPEGEIYTDFVSGKMSSYDRGLKLSQLKKLHNADRGLLTNARCLSEGVDVPSLDGVAFIDPRSSQVDIVQAVGRAIRKSDNKTTGTIVLPVFIEDVNNAEESLQSGNFKPIWGVLNALKSHDETLSLELGQLRTNLGRQGAGGSVGSLPDKIVFDLPKTVDKSFSDALKTIVIDKTTDSWEFWYGLLLSYFSENGDTLTSRKYKTSCGHSLGAWLGEQRRKKLSGVISIEREKKLNDLDFIWDVNEYRWSEGYEYLKQYVKENGNSLVSREFVTNKVKLGSWVRTQRHLETDKKLSQDRLQKLNNIGFIWDVNEYQWNEGYKHLKQYVKDNGNALVPSNYKVNGFSLGNWISNNRQNISIAPDKSKKLNDLGFVWNLLDYKWNEGYEYLKQYVKNNKNTLVPNNYKVDGYNLGTWISTQRANKANNIISSENIKSLEDLGFVWDALDSQWNEGYKHLKQYVKDNGNALISERHKVDGFNLGQWVSVQKKGKKIGVLAPDREIKLNNLGINWNPLESLWSEGCEHLKQYAKDNGNTLVPANYKIDGFTLGLWVSRQRSSKSLTSNRKKILNDLGFVWNSLEYQWDKSCEYLKQYIKDNGNALVPANYKIDGFTLGLWVVNQRQRKVGETLDSDREEILNDLGFIWNVKDYQWTINYEHLKQYVKDNDGSTPSLRYVIDGIKLGQWVGTQRRDNRSHKVSPERMHKLNDLGFDWGLE